MSEFESLLTSLLSSDNTLRNQAEQALTSYLTQQLEQTTFNLLQALSHTQLQISTLAAMLLNSKVLEVNKLQYLQPNAVNQIKISTLSLITDQQSYSLLKPLGIILMNHAI